MPVSRHQDRELRVGVAGAGAMGRNHARLYANMRDARLVGVTDLDPARAAAVASEFATDPVASLRELLRKGIDALSVAVATPAHHQVALEAIEHGVAVLVEKPIATTPEEAREIVRSAEKHRVPVMVGHVERFNPVVAALIQSLARERVVTVSITRVGPFPPRMSRVGVLVDLAVHDIDLLRHLTGSEVQTIHALTSTVRAEREDVALLQFRMENGVLGSIQTDWLTPYKVRELRATTDSKLVHADLILQQAREFSRYAADGSYATKTLPVRLGEPLQLELEAFLDCVRTGKAPPVTGEDGLRALDVAWRCQRMARGEGAVG